MGDSHTTGTTDRSSMRQSVAVMTSGSLISLGLPLYEFGLNPCPNNAYTLILNDATERERQFFRQWF